MGDSGGAHINETGDGAGHHFAHFDAKVDDGARHNNAQKIGEPLNDRVSLFEAVEQVREAADKVLRDGQQFRAHFDTKIGDHGLRLVHFHGQGGLHVRPRGNVLPGFLARVPDGFDVRFELFAVVHEEHLRGAHRSHVPESVAECCGVRFVGGLPGLQ